MKNWKDKDRFTAKDYTDDRDGIVSQIENVNDKTTELKKRKFILSDTRPENGILEGVIWMDSSNGPNKIIDGPTSNIYYTSLASGFEFFTNTIPLESQIILNAEANGFLLLSFVYRDGSTSIALSNQSTGYKQQLFNSGLDDNYIVLVNEATGYKQQLFNENLKEPISLAMEAAGYKQIEYFQNLRSSTFLDNVTSGYKQIEYFFSSTIPIITNSIAAGYKQESLLTSFNTIFQPYAQASGYKQDILSANPTSSMTVYTDASGYKNQFFNTEPSSTILPITEAIGYKLDFINTSATTSINLIVDTTGGALALFNTSAQTGVNLQNVSRGFAALSIYARSYNFYDSIDVPVDFRVYDDVGNEVYLTSELVGDTNQFILDINTQNTGDLEVYAEDSLVIGNYTYQHLVTRLELLDGTLVVNENDNPWAYPITDPNDAIESSAVYEFRYDRLSNYTLEARWFDNNTTTLAGFDGMAYNFSDGTSISSGTKTLYSGSDTTIATKLQGTTYSAIAPYQWTDPVYGYTYQFDRFYHTATGASYYTNVSPQIPFNQDHRLDVYYDRLPGGFQP